MKKLLLAVLVLLAIPIVSAYVDVTYISDQANVNATAYNCLDATCDSVSAFSGQFIKGPYATDGRIVVRYPDARNTFDYAVFFVSKGFRPYVVKASWNTAGVPGAGAPVSSNVYFTKYPVVCRATVSELNFVNELQPNIPLVVNTNAKLDASTASAFQFVANKVGFIPPQFMQEFYGADTIVKIEVLKNNVVVHNQQREFSAVKGNSLIAETSVPVSFTYLPAETGNFLVRVTAQIVDDQCDRYEDSNAQGAFTVLQSAPQSQFYTILNQLTVNDTYPRIGQTVLVSYNKITNHADGVTGPYTPVQTDIEYNVKNGATTVFSKTETLFANPDSIAPVTYSFVFTPTTAGVYTVTVKGRANSALTTTNAEITDEESLQLNVLGDLSYNVYFNVRSSADGNGIGAASVALGSFEAKATDAQGQVVFDSIPEGTYTYTISASNFGSKRGSVDVTSDKTIVVVLHPGANESEANLPPWMNLPDSIQFQAGTSSSFNYHTYVRDEQDSDSDLVLSVTGGNSTVEVVIDQFSGLVTFSAPASFTGQETISFMLKDTQGATARDRVVVNVQSFAEPPNSLALDEATVTINEDSTAVRYLNLRDYVSDADTPVENLVFNVVSVTPSSLATARVEDKYLSVYPKQDQNGAGVINVSVTDGTVIAYSSIDLTVAPVNDAPVVISTPSIHINESTTFVLNLSTVFNDVDDVSLTYTVTPTLNVGFMIDNAAPSLTIMPEFNITGVRTFNVTATDPGRLSAKVTAQLFLGFVDDAPFFNSVIPNINTYEEVPNSIDLTPFENDPEEGPGANGNTLNWKMQFANQSNMTPVNVLSNALFTATLNSTTDYLLVVPKANATGSDNITLYLFDGTGRNASQNISVTILNVNDAPVFVNLSDKTGEAGIVFTYQVNATDVDPTNDTLTFSLVNVTPALSGFAINSSGMINFTPSANGLFNVTLSVCDNFNACTNGTFRLNLSDISAPVAANEITPANPSIYVFNGSYTWGINWTDNVNVSNVTFQLSGTNYTNVTQNGTFYNVTLLNLAGGNYTYRWFARDSANNLNSTNLTNFTVLPANSYMNLTLNGTLGNISVAQNSNVTIVANLTTSAGNVSLYRNGALIGSGASPLSVNQTFTASGPYNITATYAGSQNYTAASATYFVNVQDTTAPTFGSQLVSPLSPATYTSLYTFSVVVTDNVAVGNVTFELDNSTNSTATQVGNSSTYQVNLTSLTVGNHTFKWFANDTSNNVNSTSSANYTVTQGTPVIDLLINGVAGNVTAQAGNISMLANVTNPAGGFVNLYVNGTQVTNGTSPLSYSNVFNGTASFTIPITAIFPGNTNVSAGQITRYLTVVPAIAITNISPASGASFNYSNFQMNVTTSAVTTCSWDFNDVAQASMSHNFTTSDGLNHVANITGLTLGSKNVSVACNSQNSAQNTDLTYIVQNILDGSTLVGTNTINSTIMKSSTINASTLLSDVGFSNALTNVTASNSTINNSVLTNCVISNATVLTINASNCNLANGFYDPSDLTGSNIQSSNVRNSNVTYSTVSNSSITGSNIFNSTISGSTIVNSTFSNAVVTNANITNNVIYSGTITVSGITYNASSPANLSQIVPIAPVAGFSISGSTTPGSTLTFTSTSTDANIPGPLNDSLSYNWTFSDNSTNTSANVSKTYAIAGSYNATLTVTDRFNLSNTASQTFNIATPVVVIVPTGGSGHSGGGGGGGGGGSVSRIALTDAPLAKVVFIGQPLQFSRDTKPLQLPMLMRRADMTAGTTEWVLNGVFYTIKKGEHKLFDLSKDGVADLDLAITDVSRTTANIVVKNAGAPEAVVAPLLPLFNFTATPKVTPKVEPVVPVVPLVEEPQADEKIVPVQAEVKDGLFTRLGKALKDLFTFELSAKSTAVKVGIVVGVVVIGLSSYLIFVRWESF